MRRRRWRSAGHAFEIPSGGLLLLLPVLLTWASDIGAYAFGRTFGKHKLIPSVSPGKTVEGRSWRARGIHVGRTGCIPRLCFILAARISGFKRAPVIGVLFFGALISVAAQIGDLAESLLKREAGVKDSSTLLPGHGGILDRFDSLLFVLPVSYVLLERHADVGAVTASPAVRRAAWRFSDPPDPSARRRFACSRGRQIAFA